MSFEPEWPKCSFQAPDAKVKIFFEITSFFWIDLMILEKIRSCLPKLELAGHILDLYCVRLSNAGPFCQNYAKLYFDAKHLEKRLNIG